mgnify:CR=1 FL=1
MEFSLPNSKEINMKINQTKVFFFLLLIITIISIGIFNKRLASNFAQQPDAQRVVDFPIAKKGKLLFSDKDGSAWMLDDTYQSKKNIKFNGSTIHFKHSEVTKDDWDYISIDPNKQNWVNYAWEFDIKRMTEFREFAFNFRNLDFDNRYRYRFEDNKIFFDKKVGGQWINNIASIDYPLALNKSYHVKIEVIDSIMRCYVDGVLKLENVDTDIATGTIAIILWEDDGKTPIEAEVSNNVVHALQSSHSF